MAMQVNTRNFGVIEADEGEVLEFREGIAPFTAAKRYLLLAREDEAPFMWLQSTDEPNLAFVCAPIGELFPADVAPTPPKYAQDNALMLSIITLNDGPAGVTANLLAPLVVDCENRRGWQVIREADVELCRVPIGQIGGGQ
jgi:flagellar assembly factor FliW